MGSIFISDGWTLCGRWDAVPGLYPAGSFRYRPAAPSLRFRYGSARDAAQQEQIAAQIMAEQVIDVSVEGDKDEQGNPRALTLKAEQFQNLHGGIFDTILAYVMGWQGPLLSDREKN